MINEKNMNLIRLLGVIFRLAGRRWDSKMNTEAYPLVVKCLAVRGEAATTAATVTFRDNRCIRRRENNCV